MTNSASLQSSSHHGVTTKESIESAHRNRRFEYSVANEVQKGPSKRVRTRVSCSAINGVGCTSKLYEGFLQVCLLWVKAVIADQSATLRVSTNTNIAPASLRRERLQPPLVDPVRHVQILLPCALGALHAPGSVRFAVNAGCAELAARSMIQSPARLRVAP